MYPFFVHFQFSFFVGGAATKGATRSCNDWGWHGFGNFQKSKKTEQNR